MKTLCLRVAAIALLLAPAAGFAAGAGYWAGPYVGIDAGVNRTSANNFSTENAFTTGLRVGLNGNLGDYFVAGLDLFYHWNQNKDHTTCLGSGNCGSVNLGSNVYGLGALIGVALGNTGQFLLYIKSGYSHLDVTGDQASGSDNDFNPIGAGFAWALSRSLRIDIEYTHDKFSGNVGAAGDNSFALNDWETNNFTVGVNFHF